MKTRKTIILIIVTLAIIHILSGCQTTSAWSRKSSYPKGQNHTIDRGMVKYKFDTGNHKPLKARQRRVKPNK